jgi:protein kinase
VWERDALKIYKICSVLGTPTKDSWTDGLRLAMDINYQFPEVSFASPNPFE